MPRVQFAEVKRTGLISLRLRAWEHQAIRYAARASGLSVSDYARTVLLADSERRVTAQDVAAHDAD